LQFDHRPKKQLLWAVVFCMCGTHERSLTLPNKQVQGPLQGKKCQFCVYRTVHGSTAPPNKINILWPKCATAPLKTSILQFCNATAPPSLELLNGCNGRRRGWGWGCRGRGKRRWGWGVREFREGFLATHRSQTLISAIAPQLPLFFFGVVLQLRPPAGTWQTKKKKRREGSSRGVSKRKLLKETQNQRKETRKKEKTQV